MKRRALIIIFLVLLIDQASKFWIKTNLRFEDPIYVFGHWFQITFVENPGMAFGLGIPGDYGKLILSVFRIIAVSGIGYFLFKYAVKKTDKLVITATSLIFAGALGNIIDSAFYGLIFSESSHTDVAEFLPAEGGYAGFLHGHVVDMLYFPLFEGTFPDWFPFWGGEHFEFFRPVFNIADSSISVGVVIILLFQKRFFGPKKDEEEDDNISGGPVKTKDPEEKDRLAPSEEILPVPPVTSAASATSVSSEK